MEKIRYTRYLSDITFKQIVNKINEIVSYINKLEEKRVSFIKYPCPYCSSKKVILHGKRMTLERGKVQRYFCKDCKKSFHPKSQEYRMRASQAKVDLAYKLYQQGMTSRDIAKRVRVSHVGILKWFNKFKLPRYKRKIDKEMTSRWGTKYKREFTVK